MYNTFRTHLALTGMAQPAGLQGLLDVLEEVHQASARFFCHLSHEGARRAVSMAYYASQRAEEGRYSQFRLFSYPDANKDDQLRTAIKFSEPIPLDPENLRRIAPIATAGRHAMVVVERQSSLYITRLITLQDPQDVGALGRPEFWVSQGPPVGLMISVKGPGELHVTQDFETVVLRAGRVHELGPVSSVPGVVDWMTQASHDLHGQIVWSNPAHASYFGGANGFRGLLQAVWSELLRRTMSLKHGGAFVVVPSDGYKEFFQIEHAAEDSDLSARVTNFWQRSAETLESGETSDFERWTRLHSVFRRYIYALAALSTVDGAVVFTRDLRLLGFASEIIVDEARAKKSPQVLTDAKTGRPRESQSFGGTRHRSAFRLCKVLPNSLAFVVSQDGDLSVFYSVPEKIFAWGSLEPRYV